LQLLDREVLHLITVDRPQELSSEFVRVTQKVSEDEVTLLPTRLCYSMYLECVVHNAAVRKINVASNK